VHARLQELLAHARQVMALLEAALASQHPGPQLTDILGGLVQSLLAKQVERNKELREQGDWRANFCRAGDYTLPQALHCRQWLHTTSDYEPWDDQQAQRCGLPPTALICRRNAQVTQLTVYQRVERENPATRNRAGNSLPNV
jgi:hypothetical protein